MSTGSGENSSPVIQWNYSQSPVPQPHETPPAVPGFGGTDSHLHVLQLRHSRQQAYPRGAAPWRE